MHHFRGNIFHLLKEKVLLPLPFWLRLSNGQKGSWFQRYAGKHAFFFVPLSTHPTTHTPPPPPPTHHHHPHTTTTSHHHTTIQPYTTVCQEAFTGWLFKCPNWVRCIPTSSLHPTGHVPGSQCPLMVRAILQYRDTPAYISITRNI